MRRPVTSCRRTLPVVALLLLAALAGCSAQGDGEGDAGASGAVSLTDRACPVDVGAALIGEARCATLRVPADWQHQTGTVALLVTTLSPPGTERSRTSGRPLVVVGTDLATRPNYAGLGPLAQRTGRTVVFLEQRGTAHSAPSLACWTTAAEDRRAWEAPTGSRPWVRLAAREAARCHDRLLRAGIDPTDYTVDAIAQDLAALVRADDLGPVDVATYGSTSRIALALMAAHPDLVHAAVLDTPDVPGSDPRRTVGPTTLRAVRTVLRWCIQDAGCRARHPHPDTLLHRALTAVEERPLVVDVRTGGDLVRVPIDPALVARLARQSFTDGGSAGTWGQPASVPRLLDAVTRRDADRLKVALGELLGSQGPWCAGYRPKCMTAHSVAEGVWDTVLCHDVQAGRPVPPRPTAGRATVRGLWQQAYDRAWWWQVCPHWPVGRSTRPSAIATDVPILVLAGGLAPTTPVSAVRRAFAGASRTTVLVDRSGSHNVLGDPCVDRVRDAWLLQPGSPPRPARCLAARLRW